MKSIRSIRNVLIVALAAGMLVGCGKKEQKKPATTTQNNAQQDCGTTNFGGFYGGFNYNPNCYYNPMTGQYQQGGFYNGQFTQQGVITIEQAKSEITTAFANQLVSRVAYDRHYTYSNNTTSYSLGGILNFNFSYGTGWGYPTTQTTVLNSAAQVINQMDNSYMPGTVTVATPVAQRSGSVYVIKYQGSDGQNTYETTYQYDMNRPAAYNPTHIITMKYGFNQFGGMDIQSGTAIYRQ